MTLLATACIVGGGLAINLSTQPVTSSYGLYLVFILFGIAALVLGSVFLILAIGVFFLPSGFRYAVLWIGVVGIVGGAFTPGDVTARAIYIGINLVFALLSVPLFSRRAQQWIVSRRSPYKPILRPPLAGFPAFAVCVGLLALGVTAMTGAMESMFSDERGTYKPVEAVVTSDGYCYHFTYTWPGETEQYKATGCEIPDSLRWKVGDEVTIYVDPTRPSSGLPRYAISGLLMGGTGATALALWTLAILLARKRVRTP